MTGFWESELGTVTGNPEDAFTKGLFRTVPDNTLALAKINSFCKMDNQGLSFLNIEWLLTDGDFQGQLVNQKLKVLDADPRDKDPAKTRHRALNMLKLLYQLFAIKPKHNNVPTDDDLFVFVGKQAGIRIRETEPNDQGKQYNWVSEVHNAIGFKCETGKSVEVTHTRDSIDTAFSRNRVSDNDLNKMDDDIPF